MANKRILSIAKGPISFESTFYTPIPFSWSQKRRKSELGNWDTTRPDIDNYEKFSIDAFSGILFEDDNQVCETYSLKKYSKNPRTEIYINILGNEMISEHAITAKNNLTEPDIEYIVKKANRMGMNNRKIEGIRTIKDKEGTHYIFECSEIRKNHSDKFPNYS